MSRLLRFSDLKDRRIVNNRMTLSRWIRQRDFPAPIQLGPNSVAWREEDVETWLTTRQVRVPSDAKQEAS